MTWTDVGALLEGIVLLAVSVAVWRYGWAVVRTPLRFVLLGRRPSAGSVEFVVVLLTLLFGVWGLATLSIVLLEVL